MMMMKWKNGSLTERQKKTIQRKVAKAQRRKGFSPIGRHERIPLNGLQRNEVSSQNTRFPPSRLCDFALEDFPIGEPAQAGPPCWIVSAEMQVSTSDPACCLADLLRPGGLAGP